MIDPEIQQLLVLQDRDVRRDNLKKEIEALPRRRERMKAEIAEAEGRIEQARARLQELERRRADLEGTAEAAAERIIKLKNQQMNVKKNEEYTALEHEITAVSGQKDAAETEQLEVMMEVDEAREEFVEAEAKIRRQIAALEGDLEASKERETTLLAELEGAEAQVKEAEAKASPHFLEAYQRVKQQLKTPPYVAPIVNQVSSRSHLKVSNELHEAARKHGEVHYCEHSSCIVYIEK